MVVWCHAIIDLLELMYYVINPCTQCLWPQLETHLFFSLVTALSLGVMGRGLEPCPDECRQRHLYDSPAHWRALCELLVVRYLLHGYLGTTLEGCWRPSRYQATFQGSFGLCPNYSSLGVFL